MYYLKTFLRFFSDHSIISSLVEPFSEKFSFINFSHTKYLSLLYHQMFLLFQPCCRFFWGSFLDVNASLLGFLVSCLSFFLVSGLLFFFLLSFFLVSGLSLIISGLSFFLVSGLSFFLISRLSFFLISVYPSF